EEPEKEPAYAAADRAKEIGDRIEHSGSLRYPAAAGRACNFNVREIGAFPAVHNTGATVLNPHHRSFV
ncbi:MAG TPA: hypothetical protein VFT89_04240, partial [Rhizobiaceae bacterium]|nr:hypothetical protein [Rhizobiaceae bacterium]